MDKLPNVGFGGPGMLPDWKDKIVGDDHDDDEQLAQTSQDVIDILGFDPLELDA